MVPDLGGNLEAFRRLDLPPAARGAILHGTARRLFG
jgi:hypothetical protein